MTAAQARMSKGCSEEDFSSVKLSAQSVTAAHKPDTSDTPVLADAGPDEPHQREAVGARRHNTRLGAGGTRDLLTAGGAAAAIVQSRRGGGR